MFSTARLVLMDKRVLEDFQNLQMLASFDFQKMDELVQDLTNALEDSSHSQKSPVSTQALSCLKRHCRRRRGRLRRSSASAAAFLEQGNLSGGSESSLDEALRDYMENIAQQSDSDDLINAAHQLRTLAKGTMSMGTSLAESDSVNEHFSPMRPHRRRRRDKRMTVDPYPDSAEVTDPHDDRPRRKKHPSRTRALEMRRQMDTDDVLVKGFDDNPFIKSPVAISKPRKGSKTKLIKTQAMEINASQNINQSNQDCMFASSSESDGTCTNDESRDGDDEQSDFFHESGPSCGLAEVIPWWEKEKMDHDEETATACSASSSACTAKDSQFDRILAGSLDLLTPASQRNFKAKVSRFLARNRDQMRPSRRRLKEKVKRAGYRDRKLYRDPSNRDIAKRWTFGRLNPPENRFQVTSLQHTCPERFVGESTNQSGDHNMSNQMLRVMGWTPGSGLRQTGVVEPVHAVIQPRHQGLDIDGAQLK